jgi:hypothetical protein
LPRPRRRQVAVLLLLAGYALSTIASWPTYLGFFTEWARRHPERLLNDSNLDWGQDLLRLEKYLQGHGISRIRLDYFGPRGAPGYYFRERFEPWTVDRGAPGQGWFGVSEFYIMTSRYYKGHGTSRYSYEFLDAFRPAARIGSSIRLYQLQNGQGLAPP